MGRGSHEQQKKAGVFFMATLVLWAVSVFFEILFNGRPELIPIVAGFCFFQLANWVVRNWVSRDPSLSIPPSLSSIPPLPMLQGLIDQGRNKLVFEYGLPGIAPTCLLEHLREIKVGDFCGRRCEFELVGYLLRRGKVLEEIKICSKTFWGWPSSFCEKLLKYRRGSKTCKIVVSWKADEIFHNRCIN